MTSAFLTLTKGQGHTTMSKVTDVEVSAFSEFFFLFFLAFYLYFCFSGVTALAILMSVWTLSIYHREGKVGEKLTKITFAFQRSCMKIKNSKVDKVKQQNLNHTSKDIAVGKEPQEFIKACSANKATTMSDVTSIDRNQHRVIINGIGSIEDLGYTPKFTNSEAPYLSPTQGKPSEVHFEPDSKITTKQPEVEWCDVAKMLDYIFLRLFMLVIVSMSGFLAFVLFFGNKLLV